MMTKNISDALEADKSKVRESVSTVLSYIFAGILVGGVLTWGAYILDQFGLGKNGIATADERDHFIGFRVCSNGGEVCRAQTPLYRDAMRKFALRQDLKYRDLERESERLQSESLERALSSLTTPSPTPQ